MGSASRLSSSALVESSAMMTSARNPRAGCLRRASRGPPVRRYASDEDEKSAPPAGELSAPMTSTGARRTRDRASSQNDQRP